MGNLSESLSVVEPTPVSAPATTEPTVTNTTSSLEAALSSMKQLSVSDAPPPQHQPQHHRPKTVGQQNVYAHHAVSHHPPVYGANVYAPQVNSTNASLTGASGMSASAYPSSVTLTQYQPIINSYQTSSSAGPYGGSALYTAAPYTAYQPSAQPKQPPKETQQQQYDSSVASSNSLTSTTTQTQTSTAKVATTTVAGHGSGYAGGALYGAGATPAYAPYDDQLMRSTLPHHMGGYYEVGYGGRDATFGLSAGERFGRTDAASPQQVPAAALPPGYAYFAYQPPPTTYQYGVYPTRHAHAVPAHHQLIPGAAVISHIIASGMSASAYPSSVTLTQYQPIINSYQRHAHAVPAHHQLIPGAAVISHIIASGMSASAYPSSVTLTQYQPIINSYQRHAHAVPAHHQLIPGAAVISHIIASGMSASAYPSSVTLTQYQPIINSYQRHAHAVPAHHQLIPGAAVISHIIASGMSASAYPSSVTLTQYQPIINSYQTSSSAGPYGGSALYTAAPYTAYQPSAQPKQPPKETQQQQYDSSVASSNSLTSTTTQTQTSTAKVATTTVAGHGSGYAGGALYGAGATPAYAPYDDQLMRSTLPHHMGGYYEVGYGGRDATFGLSAGERFGRTDAASPQQVPAAALPPGYAYFAYQPPPTTYQYGVYPTGKVSTYTQQQPYDAQDSYKPVASQGLGRLCFIKRKKKCIHFYEYDHTCLSPWHRRNFRVRADVFRFHVTRRSVGPNSARICEGKVSTYTQQQPYDAQDSYKPVASQGLGRLCFIKRKKKCIHFYEYDHTCLSPWHRRNFRVRADVFRFHVVTAQHFDKKTE
uniref:Uncharacterized protein n=1 Tax=Heliothis virescens TaxID=7102 RepID=A0A2A4JCB4_HELVI